MDPLAVLWEGGLALRLGQLTVRSMILVFVLLFTVHVQSVRGESCGQRAQYLPANTGMELLTSPSYPNDYDNNEHCQWVLTTDVPGHIVQIETVATDLVNWDGGDCEDYVAVHDGLDSTKPLLKKWCGTEKIVIKSSDKFALVVFHTDQQLTSRGFALKFYSIEKYFSRCDPDRTVYLETSFNPIFVDLPSYAGNSALSEERVQCRYLLTTNQEDAGQVLSLKLHSAILCQDGNFTIYDGPNETSPRILTWCYGSNPFDVITTSLPQTLIVFTLLRPDVNWHVLRLRALARSKPTGCSDVNIPTVQVSSEPTFISFPYTISINRSQACSLRLWAKGRFQTLRLDVIRDGRPSIPCGAKGIDFFDGTNSSDETKLIGQACEEKSIRSSTHNLLVSPRQSFPANQQVLMRVVALGYPCNNNTERREAYSDRIETLPSLATNTTGYPNDANCRYLLSASLDSDSVEVQVEGRMVARSTSSCDGDYIAFYDGQDTSAMELRRWCGVPSRQMKVTSSGPHLLVLVMSDHHDNQYDGFTLTYYSVPGRDRCSGRTELTVNATEQSLTSPNYPFYYPINSYCEWLLTAEEGNVIVVKVIESEMESDCSDRVLVYDGKEKSQKLTLGRWCSSELPEFVSTGRHLLLIFSADDRRNTGGFQLHYFIKTSGTDSNSSVWPMVGGLLAAVIIIIAIVVAVVLFMRYWRREQHKI